MKTRLISLIVILAMAFSVLAGCSSNTATPSTSPSTSTSPSASAPAESTDTAPSPEAAQTPDSAPPPDAAPAPDEAPAANGKAEAYSLPLVEEMTTLTYWQQWPPFLQGAYDPNDNPFYAAMADALNVKLDITVVSTETVKETFNLMIAGGDWTDMIQAAVNQYTGGGQKAIEDEILMDLLPLIEQYAPNLQAQLENPDVRRGIVNDAGCVPQMLGMYTEPFYVDQGMWIRQDWLDEVGLAKPKTYDQLYDVLKAFKTEVGISDPLVVLYKGLSDFLSAGNGVSGLNQVVDGKVIDFATSDGYRTTLQYMNMLCSEGLINPDFTSYNESQIKPPSSIAYDNAGVFLEDVMAISGYFTTGQDLDPDFNLTPIAAMRHSEDAQLTNGYIPQWFNSKYAISFSTTCSDPVLAIRYLDYLLTDDGVILANWGVQGSTYEIDASGNMYFTDAVLNDPNFPFQLMQSVLINPGFPAVTDMDVERISYTEAQLGAVDEWNSIYMGTETTYPRAQITYTTEESDIIAEYFTDYETYTEESRLKFILGVEDINDDAVWDTYCQTVKQLNIDKVIEVYQAAYDRYLAK